MLPSLIDVFKTKRDFQRRIKYRHKIFWSAPDAERVRNTVMDASDPIEKWKDVPNWQRKLSNKYNAREFAKMHHCQVPDLYWKGRDLEKIDFDTLPGQYVIRPTIGHSCDKVFLMDNGVNLFDKQLNSKDVIIKVLREALRQNSNLEFLIEEFLRTENGEYKIPVDYKIHTFNGKTPCICVIDRLGPRKGRQSFYDENWNVLESFCNVYPEAVYQVPPKCLMEMLSFAKKLSKSYKIYVRIDFYATDKGAVFGEFTPTPSLGTGFTSQAKKMFTSYWDKYCNGMI